MTIKGVIFDKDGTLFDFQQSWANSTFEFLLTLSANNPHKLNDLARLLKFDIAHKKFKRNSPFIGGTVAETIKLISPLFPSISEEELWSAHLYHFESVTQVPVNNLHKTLSYLKSNNYCLGVATNDLEKSTLEHLGKEGIIEYFDCVVAADSGFGAKPAPTQLIEISRKLDLNFSELLMVGDSSQDLVAANKVGITAIGVLTGVASKKDLSQHSSIVLKDISKLASWLETYNS